MKTVTATELWITNPSHGAASMDRNALRGRRFVFFCAGAMIQLFLLLRGVLNEVWDCQNFYLCESQQTGGSWIPEVQLLGTALLARIAGQTCRRCI
jgi:hypothetical protein